VKVEKTGNMVLVLNTYDPVTWRVSSGVNTRIVGVLLTGYYTSTVQGIAPETPVINADYHSLTTQPKPTPSCLAHFFSSSSAYRGGPDALVLDRQVLALTGRTLDGLRGAYHLKEVVVW
jgi:hypothetical protein